MAVKRRLSMRALNQCLALSRVDLDLRPRGQNVMSQYEMLVWPDMRWRQRALTNICILVAGGITICFVSNAYTTWACMGVYGRVWGWYRCNF
jgi:hypothetical protein